MESLSPVVKPRTCVFRSNAEWASIRARYEHSRPKIALRTLAAQIGVSDSTLIKRAASEHWQWLGSFTPDMQQAASSSIALASQKAAELVAARVMDDLAPWIESEKRKHIKSQVGRAKRSLKRLDKVSVNLGPKEEAFVAGAADKWDNIARRNLGMNDMQPAGGAFSSGTLVNHGAIQFVASPAAAADSQS